MTTPRLQRLAATLCGTCAAAALAVCIAMAAIALGAPERLVIVIAQGVLMPVPLLIWRWPQATIRLGQRLAALLRR